MDIQENHRRANTKVFNAYLTPNSLTFLQLNGMNVDSIAMLYSKESTRKRHKSSIRFKRTLIKKFSPMEKNLRKLKDQSPEKKKTKDPLNETDLVNIRKEDE